MLPDTSTQFTRAEAETLFADVQTVAQMRKALGILASKPGPLKLLSHELNREAADTIRLLQDAFGERGTQLVKYFHRAHRDLSYIADDRNCSTLPAFQIAAARIMASDP